MPVIRRVVDDRTFLLGLDGLYRGVMKRHERGELRQCARRVASALGVAQRNYPVEGYYPEDEQLTEYFLLMRTLQDVDVSSRPMIDGLPDFRRLLEVASSPIFGVAVEQGGLFPLGRDPLSQALLDTAPGWNLKRLTEAAEAVTRETKDISLVGLAARVRDTVVLTALRESVVLYAEVVAMAAEAPPKIEYDWRVDPELAEPAGKFVATFNALFRESLPEPESENAGTFWNAAEENNVFGRCVRLGYDDTVSPIRQYHWAVFRGEDMTMNVQEFWHPEIWTTKRYYSAVPYAGPCTEV
jgi:hypothetical protein